MAIVLEPFSLQYNCQHRHVKSTDVILKGYCKSFIATGKVKDFIWAVSGKLRMETSPCRENSDQSRTTEHFESPHSCNSPAAARAPASGQRSGSSWLLHRQRLQPRYLGAGCLPAPQTVPGRECGWVEDAVASRCSSGRRKQKWGTKEEKNKGKLHKRE